MKDDKYTRIVVALGIFAFVSLNPSTYESHAQCLSLVTLLFYIIIGMCFYFHKIILLTVSFIGFNIYYFAYFGISWLGLGLEAFIFGVAFWIRKNKSKNQE